MNDERIQTLMESIDPARDLTDNTLNELLPRDQLMAKIAAGINAEAVAPLRITHASARYRVTTFIGASVAAISVVVAAALMLFGSSPALVQGTGAGSKTTLPSAGTTLPSPVLRVEPGPVNSGVADPPSYNFTADPSLSTTVGSATAYELTAPSDLASATGTIATALGVSGPITYLGPGNYQSGPSSGPDVVVGTDGGILTWQYPDWTDQPPGVSVPVNDALPVPTDVQAIADARQLLLSMGVSADQLGTPLVKRASAAATVYFPMVVDGVVTDQYSSINFGHGASVLAAQGIITTATPAASYPTISPAQAVALLTQSSGGSGGGLNQSSGGSSGSDVLNVDINKATLELATYVLTDGTSWLLPTWSLSGPESGSLVTTTGAATYGGMVLAVANKFVQPAPRN